MKIYRLNRHVDISGVSGTGIVAHAVVFADGTTCVKFQDGLSVYRSFAKAVEIHGHNGDTTFELVGEYEGAVHRYRHEHGHGHRGAVLPAWEDAAHGHRG